MKDFIFIIVLILIAIILIVLLIATFTTRAVAIDAKHYARLAYEEVLPVNEALGTTYLFFIGSDDQQTVTVNVDENNPHYMSVTMPTGSSNITAFTNIPLHKSYDLGSLVAGDLFFNRSKSNPIDTSSLPEDQAYVINGIVNAQPEPFIEQEPNCTLSFTIQNADDTQISHIDTIAKMISIVNNPDTGNTTISFIILDGNKLVPARVYEYVAITVDDFWDYLGFVASAAQSGLVCTVSVAATAGLSAALCTVSVLGTVSAYGKAVSG